MKILVTGGAGYVGSHCVRALCNAGHSVVVLDNLSQGHAAAVDRRATFVEGDLADGELLARTFGRERFDGVMHFAAFLDVGESVTDPLKYYRNNVANTIKLLQAMADADVRRLVFSSTCATYGEPASLPITEDMPQQPINPYGCTKLTIEWAMRDCAAAWGLAGCALRYFNAAGAAPDGSIGEDHDPETHLIPIVLEVALGRRDHIKIFGDDYPTPDGTCIRDYIHVDDLADAHLRALETTDPPGAPGPATGPPPTATGPATRPVPPYQGGIEGGPLPGTFRYYNVGTGLGTSVKEVIEAARRVTGHAIPTVVAPRRPGDPPLLYADPAKIKADLGWVSAYTDITRIIETAWQWHSTHPNGYAES